MHVLHHSVSSVLLSAVFKLYDLLSVFLPLIMQTYASPTKKMVLKKAR
jgi:hypothetical protein